MVPLVQIDSEFLLSRLGKLTIYQDMNKLLIANKLMLKCHVCVLFTKVQHSSLG